jgi:phospholipid transport system substrate-binding protein
MNIKKITFLLLLLTAFPLSQSPAQGAGPGEVVVATIDRGIKILEDPSLQGFDRYQERKDMLWSILMPVFDFETTSKRALGHHWQDRTEKERKEFVSVFTNVLRDIYLGKTDSYSGGGFIYIREVVKENRGKVQTNFITSNNKKVVVDFSMHYVQGAWKVYDITIEGVSMVGNYRNQFNAILAKSPFEDLMKKLYEKRDEFAQ